MNDAEQVVRSAREGLNLFLKAAALDPDFALAYGMAAQCYSIENQVTSVTHRHEFVAEAIRLARRAVELGKDDAIALSRAGYALAYVGGEIEEGAALLDRALLLNPNLALAWNFGGWTKIYLGEPEAAIERMAQAMRLSPLDPLMFLMLAGTASGHLYAGRYDDASAWAARALRERPSLPLVLRIATTSFAHSGRLDEARKLAARIRETNPGLRISNVKTIYPLRRPKDLETYCEGLRIAGVPE